MSDGIMHLYAEMDSLKNQWSLDDEARKSCLTLGANLEVARDYFRSAPTSVTISVAMPLACKFQVKDLVLLKQIQNEAAIASNFFYKESNLLAQVDEVFHSMQPTCQSIYYVTTWEGKNRRCVCEGSIQKGIAIKFVQGQYVTSKKDGQIYKIQGFQYRLATLVYELGLGESTVIRNVAEEDHLEAIDLGLAVKAHFGYKAGDWVEAFWTIHRNHSYPALINAVLPDNVFDVKYWDGEKGRISRNDIVAHLSVIPRIPQKRGWCIFQFRKIVMVLPWNSTGVSARED